MEKNIEMLRDKFESIKETGWIECKKKGFGNAGNLFEKMLGIESNELPFPDYEGIEIKTKKYWSETDVRLFCLRPDSHHEKLMEHIANQYGYPDKDMKEHKVFSAEIYADKETLVSYKYYFKLRVNNERKRIELIIKDLNGIELSEEIWWDFDDIKKIIDAKLTTLALVNYYRKIEDEKEYVRFFKADIYRFKNFDLFLQAINKGKIRIMFNIGVYKSGKRIGNTFNHGTSFEISKHYLEDIYNKLYTFR